MCEVLLVNLKYTALQCCSILYSSIYIVYTVIRIVLYSFPLSCIVLHYIVLYYIIVFALHCIALHCIVLYCIVLYCIVLLCFIAAAKVFRSGQAFCLLSVPVVPVLWRCGCLKNV
jgi:hypothetical protein